MINGNLTIDHAITRQEKETYPNMREVGSAQGLADSLCKTDDKLIVIGSCCGGCRTLHPKVEMRKPNGMAPAAAATVMPHAQWNAHVGHPLPRNAPRKVTTMAGISFLVHTCEVFLCFFFLSGCVLPNLVKIYIFSLRRRASSRSSVGMVP